MILQESNPTTQNEKGLNFKMKSHLFQPKLFTCSKYDGIATFSLPGGENRKFLFLDNEDFSSIYPLMKSMSLVSKRFKVGMTLSMAKGGEVVRDLRKKKKKQKEIKKQDESRCLQNSSTGCLSENVK
jgi:hypothetical protein